MSVKKEMNQRFNIITTAVDWVKRILKTMFELMLTKMTREGRMLPEGRMKFKSIF